MDSCDALWLTTDTEHTCVHVTRVRTRPEMSVTVWPTFIVICNPSQTLTLQLPASVVTVTLIIVWFVSIWRIWHPLTGLVTSHQAPETQRSDPSQRAEHNPAGRGRDDTTALYSYTTALGNSSWAAAAPRNNSTTAQPGWERAALCCCGAVGFNAAGEMNS